MGKYGANSRYNVASMPSSAAEACGRSRWYGNELWFLRFAHVDLEVKYVWYVIIVTRDSTTEGGGRI